HAGVFAEDDAVAGDAGVDLRLGQFAEGPGLLGVDADAEQFAGAPHRVVLPDGDLVVVPQVGVGVGRVEDELGGRDVGPSQRPVAEHHGPSGVGVDDRAGDVASVQFDADDVGADDGGHEVGVG